MEKWVSKKDGEVYDLGEAIALSLRGQQECAPTAIDLAHRTANMVAHMVVQLAESGAVHPSFLEGLLYDFDLHKPNPKG